MSNFINKFPESTNLVNKVIVSFATSQKLNSDLSRREINTWNPYYMLFRLFFYLTGAEYVHCEVAFQSHNPEEKLLSFTSISQGGVVCMERNYDDNYRHFELVTTTENKKMMYDFVCSQVGNNFDREGSLMMPYWSGGWKRSKNWYCISLVIETLKIGKLLPNIRPNCYSVDELYSIISEHTSLRTLVPPRLVTKARRGKNK